MRYPKPLRKGGTIGFIAPSFGCAIEPYDSRFKNALKIFKEMGYKTYLGPNCYEASGIGISNTPEKCGNELNSVMIEKDFLDSSEYDKSDVIITCGGGELMVEVVPFIDFDAIKRSKPKWYMGYSDNTNYTFLSNILADTAAIYGPCAPAFGREPWHESVGDAFKLICGEIDEVSGYGLWEKDEAAVETSQESEKENDQEINQKTEQEEITEPDPLEPYNVNTKTELKYLLPNSGNEITDNKTEDKTENVEILSGNNPEIRAEFSGRLLGGCVDILTLLCGTRYDKVDEFLERYKDDGIVWFLECCDLDPLSMRRAFWQLRGAGWFRTAKGFLIGRPLHFEEEMFGADQYNAVTSILGDMGVPIVMDTDIGHLPPMMPIVSGALGDIKASGNEIKIKYLFE